MCRRIDRSSSEKSLLLLRSHPFLGIIASGANRSATRWAFQIFCVLWKTYLIISSLTSYSLAVGNKEQMRWSIASMSGQPGLSACWISCIMSARLLKPPDWRKTRGELGADANPLLACRTMASRLAWVAGKAISCLQNQSLNICIVLCASTDIDDVALWLCR